MHWKILHLCTWWIWGNKITCGNLVNLSEAFDTAFHLIILNKLKYYCINYVALLHIKSYFSNIFQYIKINNKISTIFKFSAEFPRYNTWSFIFIIYINDLPSYISNKCVLYADDTTFSVNCNSVNSVVFLVKIYWIVFC